MDVLSADPLFQDEEMTIQQSQESDQLRRPFSTNTFLSHDSDSHTPITTTERQRESTAGRQSLLNADECVYKTAFDRMCDLENQNANSEKTVLYLAYGSNLAADVFLRKRNIKPLSQIKVLVPELKLTFDIPGLPYWEPCFAGARFRHVSNGDGEIRAIEENASEKSSLLTEQDYHKDRWCKPLVGLVYEVTLSDYARITATEGGGRAYRDVAVTCYPFPKDYDAVDPVPDQPNTEPFLARTLLSPVCTDDAACLITQKTVTTRIRYTKLSTLYPTGSMRPDPSYAQPSARYLDLISTGAAENDFPLSYRAYLSGIRHYRATTVGQRVGVIAYMVIWGPWLMVVMLLSSILAGPDGRSPPWLAKIANTVFKSIWDSYDGAFRKLCGDGERTIGDT